MTKKTWIIFATICVALIAGLVAISQGSKVDVSNIDTNVIQQASNKNGNIGDHVFGKADSKVVLIEYGDYQCPGCGSAYPIIKEVTEKYEKQIAFVFRNFPLYSIHPNAFAAASTAEAAGLQGKFWEMHNYLYENQNSWNQLTGTNRTSFFKTAANNLGLDTGKLETDLTAANVKRKIDFDVALGKKLNITGTPTLYLNGKNISDIYTKDGKIVDKSTADASFVWTDADALEKLVIIPALQEHGIALPSEDK